MAKIKVEDTEITVVSVQNEDYISLTDMAHSQMQEHIVFRWMSLKSTIEYLGEWEMLYNPNFNCTEFDTNGITSYCDHSADVDAADRLRRERVLLALAVAGGEAQREVLHGQLPLPVARRVPRVLFADDARRGAHQAVVHLHRLRQQRHHVAN